MKYKNILKYIYITLIFFFSILNYNTFAEDINSSWNTEIDIVELNDNISNIIIEDTENKNTVIEYIENRKNNLEDKLWINQETDNEKKLDETTSIIDNKNTEIDVINEYIESQKLEKDLITEKLEKDRIELELLESEIKKILEENSNNSSDLINEKNIKITELKKNILELEENKLDKENQLTIANIKIEWLITEIEEYKIYKQKYEQKVSEDKEINKQKLYQYAYIYLLILIVFIIILLISKKLKKNFLNKTKKSVIDNLYIIDVLLWILLFFITIIYLIIIKPEIALVFILLGWSILLSIRPLISSFFSSVNILWNYTLWDKITIWKTQWEIIKITPLHTKIRELDDNWTKLDKIITLPNSFFIEKEIHKKTYNQVFKELNIVISLENSNIRFETFIKEIDNIFYKQNVDIIDNINKKRYYLDIKAKSWYEFELWLKYYIKKEVNSIENSIINYLEDIEIIKKENIKQIKEEELLENEKKIEKDKKNKE